MMRKMLMVLLAAFCLIPAMAFGQTQEERTAEVAPDCRITVKNVAGSINVQAWDQNQVHLTAILGSDVKRLDFLGGGSSLEIEVVGARSGNKDIYSTLTMSVPRAGRLFIEAVSADVAVHDAAGETEVSSVSGNVRIDNAAGALRVRSTSGDLTVSANSPEVAVNSISGDAMVSGVIGTLRAETVSGDMTVSGDIERLDAKSISGDLTLAGTAAAVKLQTVSGSIKAGTVAREVDISTTSGDVQITGEALMLCEISSVSGKISITGDLAETGRLNANSQSGSITLQTHENSAVRYAATTRSGNIKTEIGTPERASQYGPGNILRAGPAQATAVVSLETGSGSIWIERR